MAPFFSVVIPTYNRAREAAAAVRSVLAQTDGDFECLVVDDGSTDDTRARLGQLRDPRLRPFFNERNRGQHACRNQAIRQAQGEWIAFLDSDDVYLPGRLAALRAESRRRPRAGFLFTNSYLHRYGRIVGLLFDPARPLPEGAVPGSYAVGDAHLPYVTTMVAIRRQAFARFGLFREDLRILEDTELYARMLAGGLEVAALREPLAVRFLHEGQITRDHLTDFKESMIALAASGSSQAEMARIRQRTAREVAEYLWRAGRPAEARELWERESGPPPWTFLLKCLAPPSALRLSRQLRRLYLMARYHPALAPAGYRAAAAQIEGFFR